MDKKSNEEEYLLFQLEPLCQPQLEAKKFCILLPDLERIFFILERLVVPLFQPLGSVVL
jgi:hypothetical protein